MRRIGAPDDDTSGVPGTPGIEALDRIAKDEFERRVAAGLGAALPRATLLKSASIWPPGAPDRLSLSGFLRHLDEVFTLEFLSKVETIR